jgi:hypothetical protein
MIRRRFCSSSVSYSAARCDRIVGSDESSVSVEYVRSLRGITCGREERTNQLCIPLTPARILRGSALGVHVRWRAYSLPRGAVRT